jgi:hypothetical protein
MATIETRKTAKVHGFEHRNEVNKTTLSKVVSFCFALKQEKARSSVSPVSFHSPSETESPALVSFRIRNGAKKGPFFETVSIFPVSSYALSK